MDLSIAMSRSNRGSTNGQHSLARGLVEESSEAESSSRRPRSRRRTRYIGTAAIVVALCAGSAAVVVFRDELLGTAMWIKSLPPVEGGTAYTALVTLWLLALLPTSLLEVAGGFIFGFWLASLCSTLGKALGSFISFGLGRRYKDLVREKLLDDKPRGGDPGYVAGLELAMRARPFSTCLALRLAYVPEAVQNYVPAVLDADFRPFASATLLGGFLYAMLWAKLGSELNDARQIVNGGWTPEKITFLVVGVASLLAVLGLVHWNTKHLIRRFVAMQDHHLDDLAPNAPPSPHRALDASAGLV